MRILYIYSGGRKARISLLEKGSAASEFFYGYWELSQKKVKVDFIDVREETQSAMSARLLNYFYYHMQVLPCRTTGDLLCILYSLRDKLNSYDVIVATTTGIGFSLELLRSLRIVKSPVLTIHCGVMNYVYNKPTDMLTGYLLKRGLTQVFGVGELEAMTRHYNLVDNCIELNEFGVDTTFWKPAFTKVNPQYMLAVGNCGRRDYDLLMRVAAEVDIPLKVLTDRPPVNTPKNVELIRGRMHTDYERPDTELRDLYRGASLVVVPLIESLQPSGQSVTLQAMACGTPVVLTKTQGLWNKTILRDGYNCCLVEPRSDRQMTTAIKALLDKPQQRKTIGGNSMTTVKACWGIDSFSHRIHQACQRLFDRV